MKHSRLIGISDADSACVAVKLSRRFSRDQLTVQPKFQTTLANSISTTPQNQCRLIPCIGGNGGGNPVALPIIFTGLFIITTDIQATVVDIEVETVGACALLINHLLARDYRSIINPEDRGNGFISPGATGIDQVVVGYFHPIVYTIQFQRLLA